MNESTIYKNQIKLLDDLEIEVSLLTSHEKGAERNAMDNLACIFMKLNISKF